MKIGYWLGEISLVAGGTTPYSIRLLECLLEASEENNIFITIFVLPEFVDLCNKIVCKCKVEAKIIVVNKKLNILEKSINFIEYIIKEFYKKLDQSPPQISDYLNYWYRFFLFFDLDIIHFPIQLPVNFNLPFPYIVTMHDVQELHYPEFFSPQERANRAYMYWQSLEKSNAVVVSFKHVKDDLIKYFRIESEKIYICPLAYNKVSLPEPSQKESTFFKSKYEKKIPYILYPAQTWQHKNHMSLIKTIELLDKEYNTRLDLICTGKKNKFYFSTLSKYIQDSKVRENIHFFGIVSEQELCWLYQNCTLVVIPTLYEAGSFPLLEAMSLGIPVICSSVTSLPETIGDSRFTFDPLNIEEITTLIMKILNDFDFYYLNLSVCKSQINKLQQQSPINYFIETYKDVLCQSKKI